MQWFSALNRSPKSCGLAIDSAHDIHDGISHYDQRPHPHRLNVLLSLENSPPCNPEPKDALNHVCSYTRKRHLQRNHHRILSKGLWDRDLGRLLELVKRAAH